MFVPSFTRALASLNQIATQIGSDVESLADRVGTLEVGGRQPGIDAVNVQAAPHNVVGDGATNVRAELQAALSAADDSGVTIYLPPGVYRVDRFSTLGYSLFLQGKKNLKIVGIRGRTWIQHPTGMPNASVPILRLDDCENIIIDGVGFDGNWGNAVTHIGYVSDETALPQSTIHVADTSDFPSSGTFYVRTSEGLQEITYTGKTLTTFTGCSGGTGTLHFGQAVGYLDAKTGINHETQTDPKNYGLMIRGGKNITVSNCIFKDLYGDAIWIGASTTTDNTFVTGAQNIRVLNCDIDVCARDGIAFAQRCSGIVVRGCSITNTFATPIDTEPVEQGVYDVVVDSCYLSNWWHPENPARSGNLAMSISGGKVVSPSPGNFAQNYRVVNSTFRGGILISTAKDIVIANNRIILDWQGYGYAPIQAVMYCDGIRIEGNYVYDSVGDEGGGVMYHAASIQANVYTAVNFNGQPAGIVIRNNFVKVRNNRIGILLYGTGSYAQSTGAMLPGESGVATSVTTDTLTRTGAEWATDQFKGYRVRIGSATAVVVSNTADTLTLWTEIKHKTAWRTPTGALTDTPEPGEYLLFQEAGIAEISGNHIDCTDDGNGAGSYGIQAYGYRAGMRAVIKDNKIRNATGDAINLRFADANRTILSLELADNKAWDDQLTPTCTNAVRFQAPVHVRKLIMRNNQAGDGVTNTVSGLTSGYWLVNDGFPQQWAGYGSPEGVVTAGVGATYLRVDGGGSSTYYVKESGTGNTGWSAK